jgi:hypothetical protein
VPDDAAAGGAGAAGAPSAARPVRDRTIRAAVVLRSGDAYAIMGLLERVWLAGASQPGTDAAAGY